MRGALFLLTLLPAFTSALQFTNSQRTDISKAEKDKLLEEDEDAAFASFMNIYNDVKPIGGGLMASPAIQQKLKDTFKSSLNIVKTHNRKAERLGGNGYRMALNSFAVMDKENRALFLGLDQNTTEHELIPGGASGLGSAGFPPPPQEPPQVEEEEPPQEDEEPPQEEEEEEKGHHGKKVKKEKKEKNEKKGKNDNKHGRKKRQTDSFSWKDKFVHVKNQGECGSCWTYPPAAMLEMKIYQTTGNKVALSEKMLLDCTYQEENAAYDGCRGGWYHKALKWIMNKNDNKFSSEARYYSYDGLDGNCNTNKGRYSGISGIIEIDSVDRVSKTGDIIESELSRQPLAVAMFVEDQFYMYSDGIYEGCLEKETSNHAVTLSGYASDYWEIRNSWGADWGDGGYAKLSRSGDTSTCNLLDIVWGITTSNIWKGKIKEEEVDEKEDETSCSDLSTNCEAWSENGYCETGAYVAYMKDNCKKSCIECTRETCVDDHTNCEAWSENGYCETGNYVAYMKDNCKKSCNKCTEDEDKEEVEEEEEETCVDDHTDCKAWYDGGYCETGDSVTYMKDTCAMSCKLCCPGGLTRCSDRICRHAHMCPYENREEVEETCVDEDVNCGYWSQLGYCTTGNFVGYLKDNCQKSCNRCS